MSGLNGALCVGQHDLFDSTQATDHRAARELCRECPAILACQRLLLETQQVSRTVRAAGGGPVGTWAGHLHGKRGLKLLAECGTEQGYQSHRHYGEDACRRCLAAHAEQWRRSKQAQRKAS